MVGDDACTTFIELLKRMMDIFSSMEERKRNQAGKKIKPPKIKLGKLSKSDFRKLQKAGFDIKYVTVPAEKSAEVEENLLKMGGSFFKTEVGDSNNAVFAVPASQIDMIQSALKHAVAKDLQENPDKIAVKDGKDLIDTEDIGLVRRVMTDHDIPVVTFKNDDDKYMNFVPVRWSIPVLSIMSVRCFRCGRSRAVPACLASYMSCCIAGEWMWRAMHRGTCFS